MYIYIYITGYFVLRICTMVKTLFFLRLLHNPITIILLMDILMNPHGFHEPLTSQIPTGSKKCRASW